MSTLTINAKLWPDGTDLNIGASTSTFAIPFSHADRAAPFVTSLNGAEQYQFLFWNTGRRLTKKRSVRWDFSKSGWGAWTATKWYGRPPGSVGTGGPARVRADAFDISGDAPMSGTPIEPSPASTYAAGAYPLSGDDHVIGTVAGGANVVAKDPFPGCGRILSLPQITVLERPSDPRTGDPFSLGRIDISYSISQCDFAGWLQLVWGGEEMGEFMESDTLSDGSSGFNVYDHVIGGPFSVPQGNSADIIATYGLGKFFINISPNPPPGLRELVDIPLLSSPLQRFKKLFLQAFPELRVSTDLDRLTKDMPQMSMGELELAYKALKITLDRDAQALSMIDERMRQGEGGFPKP